MIPLYTQEQFNLAKTFDKLPCECYNCHSTFTLTKKRIKDVLNPNKTDSGKFCSVACLGKNKFNKVNVKCLNCNIEFYKNQYQAIKHQNHFCSQSCAAYYSNKHKSHGTRRSKLESYIEEQLTILYPNLEIHFNKKDAIGSELDIYIPNLNLAFELNGIFHYEPIYGSGKLDQIQNNDTSKSKACHDAKIDLCIIDTSAQKYVKPTTSQKYLDIITNIINQRTSLIS